MSSDRRALVTGAYGFVGRHVARALAARGYEVTGLGHGGWTRAEWRTFGLAGWHAADVTRDTLLTYAGSPALIVHCAGSGSVAYSMTHPFQDYERTVATTLAVLEYMRLEAPQARLVIPSSAAVYGAARQLPIAVDDPQEPVSAYGVHKKIAEDLCRSYARHFGAHVALVRLFSVYGEGLRKQLLWDACQRLARGDLAFAGTGEETRDFLHVEDAASLLCTAGDHADPSCPTVNGGRGAGVSVRHVVERLAGHLGVAGRPHFTAAVRAGDPSHFSADISGARAWGWAPEHDLDTDLAAYAAWFKAGAA
jgi:UDP-glucose 4-epimerase